MRTLVTVGFTHGYVLPTLTWLNRSDDLFIQYTLRDTEIVKKVPLST